MFLIFQPIRNIKCDIHSDICNKISKDDKLQKNFKERTGLDISKLSTEESTFFQVMAAFNFCHEHFYPKTEKIKLEIDAHQYEAAKKFNIFEGKNVLVSKSESNKVQLRLEKEFEELKSKIQELIRDDISLEGSDKERIPSILKNLNDSTPDIYGAHIPDQNSIIVLGENRSRVDAAKRKIQVGLGQIKSKSRANRTLSSSSKSLTSEQKNETKTSITQSQPVSGADTNGSDPLVRGTLLDVMVYKGNITKLSVDAIVNAANDQLAHGAGVARAIANAAGDELVKEGNRYVGDHGSIPVSGVVATTAGNLPCKKVLHAVGPAMYDYKDRKKCLEDLCKTIMRCLCEATKLNMTSVAIPSISSGRIFYTKI